MPFLVKFRGQPSSYNERFSRYEIFPFWNHFSLFWAKKCDFYRVTDTRLYFGNKQYPNDVQKPYLTFIAICYIKAECYIYWTKGL